VCSEGVLARDPQPRPARHQHLQGRAGGEEIGDDGGGGGNLLEVVEHQEEAPSPEFRGELVEQRQLAGLAYREGLGDGRRNGGRIGDGGERDERCAVGPLGADDGGDAQGETCLADAARPGQGEEPELRLAEEVGDGGRLGLASDQGGQR
jgi:hypothetical protein